MSALRRDDESLLEVIRAAEEARAAAEAAERRLSFLADASARLAASLDVEATLRTIADLVVPTLADWCFLEVLENGRVRQAAVSHPDPAMVHLAREVLTRFPIDLNASMGTGKVLRTGEPELYPDIPDEALQAVAQDPVHLDALRRVGFRSSLSVPLEGPDGRPVAVLSLVAAESGRRFGHSDLAMARELASRASAALASARQFAAGQAALRRALALQDASAALGSVLTAAEVAAVVMQHGRAAVGAAAGTLATLAPGACTLETIGTEGYPERLAQAYARIPLRPGRPLSDAIISRQPQYLTSIADAERQYPEIADTLRQTGYEAFVALPIVIGERAAAALSFSFRERRSFDAEERAFLATLAAQAGQALERAQLIAAERAARSEAEEANRAKAEFLATMSHELRTPLNAIGGYVDLLTMGIRGPISDLQRADLERIRRSQLHLSGLINEVLNYARIESGSVTYDIRDVPLAHAVTTASQFVDPQRREKRLALDMRLPEFTGGAPVVVRADADKLRQILLNLLSNAIKFTPVGGRITVEVPSAQSVDGMALLRVSDTGIGIPTDKLEAIFEPFVQVGRALNQPGEGTGLGLAISRDLARGMGGELRAESILGAGSTFTLVLPRVQG